MSPGLAVPVLGIFQIAFHDVHDAMKPGAQLRAVVLHEVVCCVPVTGP